jgi:hypothetical protein
MKFALTGSPGLGRASFHLKPIHLKPRKRSHHEINYRTYTSYYRAQPLRHTLCACSNGERGRRELKSMEDSWAASQLQKDHGASVVDGLLSADFFGVNEKANSRIRPSGLSVCGPIPIPTPMRKTTAWTCISMAAASQPCVAPRRKKAKIKMGKNSADPSLGSILGWASHFARNARPRGASVFPRGERTVSPNES